MPRVTVGQAELPTKPHALYRFFDRTDVLLYVGISMDLPTRLRKHRREKPWWLEIAHIAIEPHESRADALAAEAAAIAEEKPLYNDQHNPTVHVPDEAPSVVGLARAILRLAVEDDAAFDYALADAAADLECEDGSEPDFWGSDPAIFAVEREVADLQLRERLLAEVVGDLLKVLPASVYAAASERADEEHARWPYEEPGAFEIFLQTARGAVPELAALSLATLGDTATEWRLAAERAVARLATGDDVTVQAAEMAQQAAKGRYLTGMCRGDGASEATCARRAEVVVWVENCPSAKCETAPCKGHLYWCGRHWGHRRERGELTYRGETYEVIRAERVSIHEYTCSASEMAVAVEAQLRSAEEVRL
jgi:predicted GIY-YIG superfamily endonuclease